MSVMSDLDLLHRDGAVTQNDFIERGVTVEKAEAYAGIVKLTARDVFGDSRLTRDIEADKSDEPDSEGFYTVYCTGQ
jgi:hypothetical protein